MSRVSDGRMFWTITAALAFASSYAQEHTTSHSADSVVERSTPMQSGSLTKDAIVQELLLGVDANDDGIRDDLTELLSTRTVPLPTETSPPGLQTELSEAFTRSQPAHSTTGKSRCLEYLLMEPEDQVAADRYVQSRAHGVFGTRPCDPVVSPLLERPFETDVARLQLGPVQVNYTSYE